MFVVRALFLFLLVATSSTVRAQVPTDLLGNLSPEQIDQLRQLPTGELEKLRAKIERPVAQPLNTIPVTNGQTSNAQQGNTTSNMFQGAMQIEGRVKGSGEKAKLTETKDEKVIDTKTAPPKQFGYDLFEGIATTFAPVTDIPITADYLIGPGDTVIINYFGARNEQYSLIVNREGQLTLPGIGQIGVAGMSFEAMSTMLIDRVTKQMIGVKASVTMGPLRSIRVFILGEASRPGSYTVSALSSITNALFVSGGVKGIGSLRNIELRRNNKTVCHLDLYDLLLRGDTRNDERLQPGDVIFIPKIGPTATAIGEVLRPAIYELKGEKNAEELLQLAGGLLPGAYPHSSQMERVDNHQHKTLIDVDLTDGHGTHVALQDGDILRVYSVLNKLEKVVLLSGHVTRPGGLQWRPGMRLTDIVTSYDDLLPKPDMRYTIIKRELPPDRRVQIIPVDLLGALADKSSAANIELQARDELIVFSSETTRTAQLAELITQIKAQARHNDPERLVSVFGMVRYPDSYPYEENMTLQRLLQAGSDFRPRADLNQLLLVRQDPLTQASYSQLVNIAAKDSSAFKLQAGDELYVFSLDEDKSLTREETGPLAQEKPANADKREYNQKTDRSNPGFTKQAQLTAFDSADTAGSKYTPYATNARTNSTGATNAPTRQAMLKPVLLRLKQQARSGEPAPVVSISGAIVAPGEYPLTQGMKISELVTLAGKFSENAYIMDGELSRVTLVNGRLRDITHQIIDFSAIARGDLSQDLKLQPYDSLAIRPIPGWDETGTVEVSGKFRFPGHYVIKHGEKLSELVTRAGGFLDDAAPEAAVFTRENLRTKEQESMDALAQRLESESSSAYAIATNTASQTTMTGGANSAASQKGMIDSLVSRVRASKAVGRLAIDLPQIVKDVAERKLSALDVTLEDGDKLIVPSIQESVTIFGEVNFPTSIRYEEKMSMNDYVDNAGGTTQNADKDSIYVIRANGKVQPPSYSWLAGNGMRMRPGDTIIVPPDFKQVAPIALWSSAAQIFSNMAVGFAAFKTIGIVK